MKVTQKKINAREIEFQFDSPVMFRGYLFTGAGLRISYNEEDRMVRSSHLMGRRAKSDGTPDGRMEPSRMVCFDEDWVVAQLLSVIGEHQLADRFISDWHAYWRGEFCSMDDDWHVRFCAKRSESLMLKFGVVLDQAREMASASSNN